MKCNSCGHEWKTRIESQNILKVAVVSKTELNEEIKLHTLKNSVNFSMKRRLVKMDCQNER